MENDTLPIICMICHEEIKDGEPTKQEPVVPRWGQTIEVHKHCEAVAQSEWGVQHVVTTKDMDDPKVFQWESSPASYLPDEGDIPPLDE